MGENINLDTDTIQYLQMLQNNISRMSTTSAIFKGFSATIVAGIAMISYQHQHTIVIILSFVPVIIFAILDSYYLKLERKMRYIYSLVIEGKHVADFNMEIIVEKKDYKRARLRVVDIVKSPSIYIFYPAMIIILIVVLVLRVKGSI